MNLLEHRKGRLVLFTWLYASEGAPMGFIWWALPTLLRSKGVEIEKITGVLALLVIPWMLKFLWAPLVDSLRSRKWGFRSWIICAQILMGLSLIPLFWMNPDTHFEAMVALLFIHAFCAATQDVAVDALAVRTVPTAELGKVNGCMQAGMLLGRGLFGGGALVAAGEIGWPWIYAGLVLCIWSSLAVVWLFCREMPVDEERPSGISARITDFTTTLKSAFGRKSTWLGLFFALTAAAAFESTGAMAGPFLIDHGLSEKMVGVFFGVFVLAATVTGGLAGGWFSDLFGRKRSLALFLLGFVAVILVLAVVQGAWPDPVPPALLIGLLTGLYFCIGLFTASSYALFMDLTDRRLGATQFSTFMAATNGCEMWSVWAGGRLVALAGYAATFVVMSMASLLSLLFLKALRVDARKP